LFATIPSDDEKDPGAQGMHTLLFFPPEREFDTNDSKPSKVLAP
jgi:hypothetical protein